MRWKHTGKRLNTKSKGDENDARKLSNLRSAGALREELRNELRSALVRVVGMRPDVGLRRTGKAVLERECGGVMGMRLDTYNLAARRKLRDSGVNIPDNWEFFTWEALTGGVLVKGSETYTKTSGKNKGRKGWRGTVSTVIVTPEDEREEERIFEQETGNCHQCGGDGQEWAKWTRDAGNQYKTCTRCSGTGKAVTA